MTDHPHFMLVAGEMSGDLLGAGLMAALQQRTGNKVRFSGVGGANMAALGLQSLFPMSELSIMGFSAVIPRIVPLLRRIGQTADTARREKPDAVITIDSPGFCFRLAKKLRGSGIPVVHYVAPQVWAWRPGRAAKLSQYLDHLLALLPFEPGFFAEHNMPCSFVGHPVVERIKQRRAVADGRGLRQALGVAAEQTCILVLPGSRHDEVSRLLPVFRDAFALLRRSYPNAVALLPTVPAVAGEIKALMANWPGPAHLIEDPARHGDAFAAADAAMAASGTVTLELVLSEVPTIAGYRTSLFTGILLRRMLKAPFVSLPNLLLERAVIPELLQQECTAKNICRGIDELFRDSDLRQAQLATAADLNRLLGGEDPATPSERAADRVLHLLK